MSAFFGNRLLGYQRLLLSPEPDAAGAGAGNKPDPVKELEAERTKNADLMKRLEALEAKGKEAPKKDDGDDLAAKAEKERLAKEKQSGDTAKLEKAIRFTTGMADFVKTNATLLPKSLESILAQAEKEKYENAMEKASAVQVALVSEFFAIQANLDLLTETQKNALAEFTGLTKNVKQERVQQIYDMVFEPAFESMKRIAKAKAVRDGEVDPANSKAAYAKKIADLSKAKFIKKGAK